MTDAAALRSPAVPASPAQMIALAGELAGYARAAQDPLAMIEAARTLRGVPIELLTAGMARPATLFGEARILAEGDAAMLAEIDWAQNGTPRPLPVVGGDHPQQKWTVTPQGLRVAPLTVLPPLNNAATRWGVSFAGKAA